MQNPTIAFIGGGNMAASLIGGLIADGWDAGRIHVAEPDPERRQLLHDRYGVRSGADNRAAVGGADVVVLAVKPQVLRDVAGEIADAVTEKRPLVISIAAGVRESDVGGWLGGGAAIVRTMPNTPALVQSGATALYANPRVTDEQRDLAESVMRAVGLTQWVPDEASLDTVTALSGSGPAYFFLVMEALEQAAVELGMEPAQARLLTLQTAFGAAKMALESTDGPAELRRRVTSPGGTTERALQVLEQGGLRALLHDAVEAAQTRSVELADKLGGK
ncbi:MAG: pyrroline-5-carboxylate reductase [Gammaproteobacteria bacterium]